MAEVNLGNFLVDHARHELEILGVAEDDKQNILNVVQAFADAGHSGSSDAWSIGLIAKLLKFENLTPLTDDPAEWNDVGEGMWQNVRRSEAFSLNGGRSYYLLSEGGSADNPKPLHTSTMVKHD